MVNEVEKLLKGIVGTKAETPDDIVQFMRGYAESMRKRYREAVEGDKYVPCNSVAMRMEDTATRLKAALWRERAQGHWLKKLWDEFSEIPVDQDDRIELPFLHFEVGTDRFDVWRWFDEHCPRGMARDLLGMK